MIAARTSISNARVSVKLIGLTSFYLSEDRPRLFYLEYTITYMAQYVDRFFNKVGKSKKEDCFKQSSFLFYYHQIFDINFDIILLVFISFF